MTLLPSFAFFTTAFALLNSFFLTGSLTLVVFIDAGLKLTGVVDFIAAVLKSAGIVVFIAAGLMMRRVHVGW